MKEEIKKILEMSKSGAINEDQAAQLIAELMKKEEASEEREEEGHHHHRDPREDFRERMRGFHHGRHGHRHHRHDHPFAGFMRGAFGGSSNVDPSNNVQMSHVENPRGKDFEFTGNTVQMAAVLDIRLQNSKMNKNRVEAGKVNDIQVNDGNFSENQISASSLNDFTMTNSEFTGSNILGSKVSDITIKDQSSVEQSEFLASAFRDIEINSSVIKSWINKAMRIEDFLLKNCKWNDVMMKASEGWSFKKRGFFDVKFENCDFESVLFTDCRFADVRIRNVNLKNFKVQNVQLSDVNINGNEEFLAAISQGETKE